MYYDLIFLTVAYCTGIITSLAMWELFGFSGLVTSIICLIGIFVGLFVIDLLFIIDVFSVFKMGGCYREDKPVLTALIFNLLMVSPIIILGGIIYLWSVFLI